MSPLILGLISSGSLGPCSTLSAMVGLDADAGRRAGRNPGRVEALLPAMAMTKEQQQAVESGAKQVDQRQQMAAGYETQRDDSIQEREPESGLPGGPVGTAMGPLTLSMFAQGQSVRVRVGDAHNGSEMFEGVFDSVEEANEALVGAGVLSAEQVGDGTEPVGTGIRLEQVTAEQLEAAGLKRHGVATL